jgi:heme/copper-type cytochrome/quinol oxidase subunit 2
VLAVWIFLAVIGYLVLGTLFAGSVNSSRAKVRPNESPTVEVASILILLWPVCLLYGLSIMALAMAGVKFKC